MNKKYCTAVVLAAGKGARMGTQTAKQYLEIGGKPVVVHALEAFQASPLIDEIILMTDAQHVGYCSREMIPAYELSKVSTVGAGGNERYESVWKALCTVMDRDEKEDEVLWADRKNGYVFIHDGARPFVTTDIIARAYEDVCRWDACVVGMPVKDTIKRVDEKGFVVDSPNRSLIWQAQTPQVFSVPLITKAFERQLREDCTHVTDDAMVVEAQMGVRVHMTNGSYENIKITTPEDLLIAEAILKKKDKKSVDFCRNT
ncbi:2-C-methyl-D-erythritol 4-phosphate cytidylyltransferase [Enterocloster citroniae]|uniref:2-C-methyl-D-erythritol 4-phosphate cytidylyltransferase n=1 Tax=Enterocloster citroniae TaxID=358743 RepID=UPI0032C1EA06